MGAVRGAGMTPESAARSLAYGGIVCLYLLIGWTLIDHRLAIVLAAFGWAWIVFVGFVTWAWRE